jgi:hypothetical protein
MPKEKSVTGLAMGMAPSSAESATDVLREALQRAADGEPVETLVGEYDPKLATAYESDEGTEEEPMMEDVDEEMPY